MKTIKTTFLTAILLFIVQSNFACKCAWPKLRQQVKYCDYVFSAKVVEILETDEYSCNNADSIKLGTKVRVQIIKTYKGQSTTETMIIDSEHNDCSYCFRLNEEYLIFGRQKGNVLVTNICSRTNRLKDNKDIKYLERHKKPAANTKQLRHAG